MLAVAACFFLDIEEALLWVSQAGNIIDEIH